MKLCFTLAALLSVTGLHSVVAVECGGRVTSNEKLQRNLACNCDRGARGMPAIELVGPARLDLNGFTISCDTNDFLGDEDVSAVIKVTGQKGRVQNGSVQGGNFGIVLAGNGRHVVKDVTVSSTGNDSLLISSNRNQVIKSEFDDCGQGVDSENNGDCIDIEIGASRNKVVRCIISNFGDDGLDIDGSDNMIVNNKIIGGDKDGEDGISVRGFRNKIVNNVVDGTFGDGIAVKYNQPEDVCDKLFGGDNQITGNTVTGSRDGDGMKIRSDRNMVTNNRVFSNDGDGIEVDDGTADCENGGNFNEFTGNESSFNGGDGFEIKGSNNIISDNKAFENESDGFKNEGNFNELSGNEGSRNEGDGFDIRELNNLIIDNKAFDNGDDGFKDRGDGNTFEGNEASGNGDDDFDLD